MARWLGWRGRCGHPFARDRRQLQKKLGFGATPNPQLYPPSPRYRRIRATPTELPLPPIIFGRIKAPPQRR